ncbi:MAG: PHP domain-containing protein [Balneolaceae bacterium]
MGKADLHIHTTASDGLCKPVDILRLAADHSLSAIAITDHDTIDGYLNVRSKAKSTAVELICGAEFTVQQAGRTIHVLSYEFDPADPNVVNLLQIQRTARLQRMEQILENLRVREGIGLDMDEVKAQARNNIVGRPHVAKVLIRKKIVSSVKEAFIRYLGQPYIEELDTRYVSVETLVKVVSGAGGVTSLAHPGPLYSAKEVEELIDTGIDGIECIHPAHNFNQQKRFSLLAERRHLLVTGGSDFHGSGEEYAPWFGVVTIGEKRVEAVRRVARNRKRYTNNRGSDV